MNSLKLERKRRRWGRKAKGEGTDCLSLKDLICVKLMLKSDFCLSVRNYLSGVHSLLFGWGWERTIGATFRFQVGQVCEELESFKLWLPNFKYLSSYQIPTLVEFPTVFFIGRNQNLGPLETIIKYSHVLS